MITLSNVSIIKIIILSMIFVLTGCTKSMTSGPKINNKILTNIKPRKSTKIELFDLLGTPKAIAIRERPMYILQPKQFKGETKRFPDLIIQVQAEPFYEIFKTKNILKDIHRVYYYYFAKSKSTMDMKITLKMDRLWVLVNEESGLVEDMVFIPHKK